jgi:hypothetical protein
VAFPSGHRQVTADQHPVDVLHRQIGPQPGPDLGIFGTEVQIGEMGDADGLTIRR